MGYEVSIEALTTGIKDVQVLIDNFEVLNDRLGALKGVRAAAIFGDRPDDAAPPYNAAYEQATQTLVNFWQQAVDHLHEFQTDLRHVRDTYEGGEAHGVRRFEAVGE